MHLSHFTVHPVGMLYYTLLLLLSSFRKRQSAGVLSAISALNSVKMSRAKQIRVLVLNDMEKLDRTLFRLEQGK